MLHGLIVLALVALSTQTVVIPPLEFYKLEETLNEYLSNVKSHLHQSSQLAQQEDSILEDVLANMKTSQPQNDAIKEISEALLDIKYKLNKEMESLLNNEQANFDSMVTVTNTLQTLPSSLADVVRAELAKLVQTCTDRQTYKETDEKLAFVEQKLEEVVQAAAIKLKTIRNEIHILRNVVTKKAIQSACCDHKEIPIDDQVLTKFEGKLNQYKEYKVPDFGNILAGEAYCSRFSNALEKQTVSLNSIKSSMSSTVGIMAGLVTQRDFAEFTNQTYDAIQRTHNNTNKSGLRKIVSKLDDLSKDLDNSQKLLLSTSTEANKKRTNMYEDLKEKNQQFLSEIAEFSSKVLPFEDIINSQGRDMYDTLNERFEVLKKSIVDMLLKQKSTLTSLGASLQTEMSKVRHLLAIMKEMLAEKQNRAQ